jgi:hypothetical protein
VAYLVLAGVFGVLGGMVGRSKGSSFFLWFLISAIVPVFGLVAALLYRNDRNEPRRRCPGCARVVKVHEALCTHCGSELDFPADGEILPSELLVRERRRAVAARH